MANTKKRVLSLLMAVMMMLTAVPMNAIALEWSDLGTKICTKDEVAHTDECYKHTEDCYHKHAEPVYALGKLICGCEYDCTEHTHSTEIGCPVENCDAHAHDGGCCDIKEHSHSIVCCTIAHVHDKECCSIGFHYHNVAEGCYEYGKLICTNTGRFHYHNILQGCYEVILVCNRTEHIHESDCTCEKPVHLHVNGGCSCSTVEHNHETDECNYACGISTEHTHDADCYSCTIAEHTHDEDCTRLCGLSTEDRDPLKCNDVTLLAHEIDCKNEEHHTHSAACYLPAEVVSDAFTQVTGVEIKNAEEMAAVIAALFSCKTGCKLDYKVLAVSPYFEVSLILCEEHFCTVCHRLNNNYCDCVEITFANICNNSENSKTVKVKAGETVDAECVPNADLLNYRFLGWFDADGNQFSTETVYTEDTTFTARYKALTEAEKLENVALFIKNNFNLGAELGRAIATLTKGEVNKETIIGKKDEIVQLINLYLLANRAGSMFVSENDGLNLSTEQIEEIVALLEQGDEYVTMIADWLWPDDVVLMPGVDEILAEIDFEKLAEEIKAFIADEYGIEFTEEWVEKNRALAEQYITNAIDHAKTLTEQQKQLVLEQIENQMEHAAFILSLIRAEIIRTVSDEIENVKNIISEILADTEMGIKLGKTISMMLGLDSNNIMYYGEEFKNALMGAIRMSSLTEAQQDVLINAIEENDGIANEFIDWLWPVVTVYWTDGITVLEKDVVAFDAKHTFDGELPTKENTAEFTYEFAGWNKAYDADNSVYTYTAVFNATVNEYTVTWMNGETVLASGSVPYGAVPAYQGETPVKEATAQYTYTFAGWDKEITAVTGDVTYYAEFTSAVNSYTVTFVVDGVETVHTYEFGAMPAYGEEPVKAADAQYTYKFAGWDNEIVAVTGNAVYTAVFTYTVNVYTVTWMNGDVLETDVVPYGTMPEFNKETPVKTGTAQYSYEFAGWDKEIAPVTGDVTYVALFKEIVNEYTVTWLDEDGTVFVTETYLYGETPVYTGATPYKADTAKYDYEFAGWDNEVVAVTGDATYTATYTADIRSYTVTFVDGNGDVLQTGTYTYGETPVYAGTEPTKTNTAKYTYTFKCWNREIRPVSGDATYTAMFDSTINEYTVTFVDGDGNVLQSGVYAYGETPVYTGAEPVKAGNAKWSYTYKGWNREIRPVSGDATYTAMFDGVVNQYTVTFVRDDNKVIGTSTVEYGTAAIAPDTTRKGYVFIGWDKDFSCITGNMTVTAQYEYEYLNSARLKINVGTGKSGSGSTKGNALSHWGTIYNVRSVYSYYDYPNYKGDSIMSESDFDCARTLEEAVPGNVELGGVVYTNGADSSDNYYVLTGEYYFVACRGEYHLDYKAAFYNVTTFMVGEDVIRVATERGAQMEMPADPVVEGYDFDGWEMDENGVYVAKLTKIHKVTFALPGTGGKRIVYVRDGGMLDEFWAEDSCYEYEVINYWYNSKGGAKLDFATYVVTGDVTFSCKTKAKYGDWDVKLVGIYNGKNIDMGMAQVLNVAHAGNYRKNSQNIAIDASKFMMPEMQDIVVDGVTFTYGKGSSDNYYTIDFNNLTVHSEKIGKKVHYTFVYNGEIELFHDNVTVYVKIVDGGTRKIEMNDVAHGTVIDTAFVAANVNSYLVVEESLVINAAGEYTVYTFYTGP